MKPNATSPGGPRRPTVFEIGCAERSKIASINLLIHKSIQG